MARPMIAVTQAITAGATTTTEISKRTGLQESTVSMVLDHLTRTGYLKSTNDSMVCDSCGLHCPATKHQCSSGLTTLTLTRRPPEC